LTHSSTTLYELAKHCFYGELQDEMIRDQIVVGIKDPKLSEKLQMDYRLTLETAIQHVRQSETIKQQQPLLWKEQSSGHVDDIPIGAIRGKATVGKPSHTYNVDNAAQYKSPSRSCT